MNKPEFPFFKGAEKPSRNDCLLSLVYGEGCLGPGYQTEPQNRGKMQILHPGLHDAWQRLSLTPRATPLPFPLHCREKHIDMGRAALLQQKQDVQKCHGRKESMIQKKQTGKEQAGEKPKKQTAL